MGAFLTKKQLVIATLNYSGILYSPYEFFSLNMENQQKLVSQTFKQMLKTQFPDFNSQTFQWNLGKIDQKMQIERYSPIYRKQAGMENNKLIDEKRFKQIWYEQFKKNVGNKNFTYTQQEMNNTLKFDLCCYKCLIQVVYKVKNLQSVQQLNAQQYKLFTNKFFSKAFLNESIKIEKVFAAIDHRKVDISFFQEINQQFLSKVDRDQFFLQCKQGVESAIVIKKDKFKIFKSEKQFFDKIDPQLKQDLDWNDDTVICFVDNLILLSGHLSSKKLKNPAQVQQMLDSIKKLKKIYPKYQIIVGVDANTFVKLQDTDGIYIYPQSPQQHTTMKKRTWIQPQTSKAQQLASTCRDHLITTVKMEKARVVTIGDKSWKQVKYIPTQIHPHDHFVVTANIQVVEYD